MFDGCESMVLKSEHNDPNNDAISSKELNDFKKDLIDSLIAPRVELRTKNYRNIAVIRNDLSNTSTACNIQ